MQLQITIESSRTLPRIVQVSLGSILIGRSSACDVVIKDVSVSREHARLYLEDGKIILADLSSSLGTWLNEKRISEPAVIEPGTSFRLAPGCRATDRILIVDLPRDSDLANEAGTSALYCTNATELRQHSIQGTDKESVDCLTDRLKVLNTLHNELTRVDSQKALWALLVERLYNILQPEQILVFHKQNDEYRVVASRGQSGKNQMFYSKTLLRQIIEEGNAMLVEDARHDQRFFDASSVHGAGICSLLASPLFSDDRIDGMIVLTTADCMESFSDADLRLLVCVAAAGTLRLHNMILKEENARHLSERNRCLEALVAERSAELQRRNAELERMNREMVLVQEQVAISKKMAALGQLTAGIAHEINNPVNFIEGNLSNLEQWGTDFHETLLALLDEEDHEVRAMFDERFASLNNKLAGIREGRERISTIIKSLYLVSRKNEAEVKRIDLREVLNAVITLLRPNYAEKVLLTFESEEPLEMECRPVELSLVFLNLINNGCQAILERFSGQDGKGKMEVRAYSKGDVAVLRFRDEGTGMPESYVNKVFEPFFTTRPPGMGTGLGLYTCYNIVDRHEGHINVFSVVGVGSTFTIRLPML